MRTRLLSRITGRLKAMPLWHFTWISVIISDLTTAMISLLMHSEVRTDYLVVGFFVPLIVAPIVIKLVMEMRKDMEKALRESEEKYRHLFEYSTEGIGITRGGKPIAANSALLGMMGFESFQECANTPFSDKLTPESGKIMYERNEKLKAGELMDSLVELQILRKDGEVRDVELSSTDLPVDGETCTLSTFRDITGRKRLEEQLLHSQKMDTTGQLTAGISHEFSNILTVIKGYGELLGEELQTDPHLSKYMNAINASTERAIKLTHGLLVCSRKHMTRLETININDELRNTRDLLGKIIGTDIKLQLNLTRRRLPVNVDKNQLEQVFMNLVNNSRDAMPEGGEVIITTERFEPGDKFKTFHGHGEPGKYARISIADTGVGLSSAKKGRMFEPFFTTKRPGEGTGLGLPIVYGIVKKHNGFVDIKNGLDRGMDFNIYLPLNG